MTNDIDTEPNSSLYKDKITIINDAYNSLLSNNIDTKVAKTFKDICQDNAIIFRDQPGCIKGYIYHSRYKFM